MANSQTIGVVINTYPHKNRKTDLQRCLNSLAKQSYDNFVVTIIENYKNKKLVKKIVAKYKSMLRINVFNSPAKKLSSLFNLGWKKTKTKYLAYLADDAEAGNDWLKNINKELNRSVKIAACSGPIISTCYPAGEMHRLYLLSQSNIIYKILTWPYMHFAMEGKILSPGKLLESGAYTLGASLKRSKKYPRKNIDLLTTSSMGIKRKVLKKVKGFNENYKFNHADGDLFIRIKKAGYKLIFNPKIVAKHFLSMGPSRNAYFIGRDTGRFYKDHIRVKTLSGLIGMILNVSVLNLYWIYSSVTQKSLKPLSGIFGFVLGVTGIK